MSRSAAHQQISVSPSCDVTCVPAHRRGRCLQAPRHLHPPIPAMLGRLFRSRADTTDSPAAPPAAAPENPAAESPAAVEVIVEQQQQQEEPSAAVAAAEPAAPQAPEVEAPVFEESPTAPAEPEPPKMPHKVSIAACLCGTCPGDDLGAMACSDRSCAPAAALTLTVESYRCLEAPRQQPAAMIWARRSTRGSPSRAAQAATRRPPIVL